MNDTTTAPILSAQEEQQWRDDLARGQKLNKPLSTTGKAVKAFLATLDAEREAHRVQVAAPSFQQRVQPWMMECFGEMIAGDKEERNHRFLEESLELVQFLGCTQGEAHQLVDYVFSRPIGEPYQESGGVMVTHAALCLANDLDMHANGETELARVWTKVDKIREKQAAKPKHSPLPEASLSWEQRVAQLEREKEEMRALVVDNLESALETIDAYRYENLGVESKAAIKYLSDEDALALCRGAAWIDDPPQVWTREQLAAHARGVLHGEAGVAGNLSNLRRLYKRLQPQQEAPDGE